MTLEITVGPPQLAINEGNVVLVTERMVRSSYVRVVAEVIDRDQAVAATIAAARQVKS